MTTRTDSDLANFREWADDAYESGLLDENDDVDLYGALAALQRSIRDTGGLIPATLRPARRWLPRALRRRGPRIAAV